MTHGSSQDITITRPSEVRSDVLLDVPHSIGETIAGLEYIADANQPSPENGGFHANARATAQSALHHLRRFMDTSNASREA